MTEQRKFAIPEPTLRRMPSYCQYLRRLRHEEVEQVSCSAIAREYALDPTQVRKDIAYAGLTGKPKVGYTVKELSDALETFLGWKNAREAILVGAGSLGTALMGYEAFEEYGVNIVLAFDTDPEKIGTQIQGREIMPLEKLPELVQRMHIHLGILTVPVDHAQSVCDLLVDNGIRGIWNFASRALVTPDNIIVQQENLFSSLGILSTKLAAALRDGQ